MVHTKVSVYQQNDASKTKTGEGIVVTQNQQIRFEQKAAQFTRTLVDVPLPVQPLPPHSFDFTNAPAATVFAQLQRAYGIMMVYDEAHLRHCPVTATLTDEPLYGKLDLICRAIEARYEVIDGQIIISGGCAD